MKRFQTSLLELISTSRSEGPTNPSSTAVANLFDERSFLRLKLYFAPYPEYRLLLGDTAPEPLRLLTISRSGEQVTRQFAVMIDKKLFTKSTSEWVVPTLLRLIRTVARDGTSPADLRGDDLWIDRLYRILAPRVPAVLTPDTAQELPQTEAESGEGIPDLRRIWSELVAEYFAAQDDLLTYRVVWSYRQQTMTLASCQTVKRVVRVASVMQREEALPHLEALVYHELCHAALGPIKRVNGRRVVHGREFKALEKRHAGIPELDRWIASGGWRKMVAMEKQDRKRAAGQ